MKIQDCSIKDLKEKLRIIIAEIESLEYDKAQIENELFYRKNPECKPSEE